MPDENPLTKNLQPPEAPRPRTPGPGDPEWDPKNDCRVTTPPMMEVVELYAALSEAVDPEDIDKKLKPASQYPSEGTLVGDKAGYVHVECRNLQDKKLRGLLRGWRNKTETKGIVLDIAVRREDQKRGVAKAMLETLHENHANVTWIGYPNRVAPRLDRDLSTIRAIYGISLSAAFGETLKTVFGLLFAGGPKAPDANGLTYLFLAFALATVGCRFYFASGNIRRYFLQRVLRPETVPNVAMLVWLHLPVLFLHAVLYFCLCNLFESMVKSGTGDYRFVEFTVVFAFLLFVNSVWLAAMHMKGTQWWPERVWISNNVASGLAALVFALIFADGGPVGLCGLWFFSAAVLINSLVDFGLSARSYLLGDALSGG